MEQPRPVKRISARWSRQAYRAERAWFDQNGIPRDRTSSTSREGHRIFARDPADEESSQHKGDSGKGAVFDQHCQGQQHQECGARNESLQDVPGQSNGVELVWKRQCHGQFSVFPDY